MRLGRKFDWGLGLGGHVLYGRGDLQLVSLWTLSVTTECMEHGKAPEKLIASKRENAKLVMTRPLYPYSERAVFKGGDASSAESFEMRR